MGCVAFLIIGAVAAAAIGLGVVRPLVRDQMRDELQKVVATQIVSQLEIDSASQDLEAGRYVISAETINRQLEANEDLYDPLEDPRIKIDPDGLDVSFRLYGTESSYHGNVEAVNGRLVLTDLETSGPAASVLSARDLGEIIESELNGYLARSGQEVTGIELGDGILTLITVEIGDARDDTVAPNRTPTPTTFTSPTQASASSTQPVLRPKPKPTFGAGDVSGDT